MFCCICHNDIPDCICPDIEERLKRIAGGYAAPAIAQNLAARALRQAEKAAAQVDTTTTPKPAAL
jgi:histidinol-phosphate/aromatic aminotransferase/cobyric acid decarboxylase-like protein